MATRRQRRAARRGQRDAEHVVRPPTASDAPLRIADRVERLAYTRRQAAEALGVSIATLDRRVLPLIETVKVPWGARLVPVDELERLLEQHRQPVARAARPRRLAGQRGFPRRSSRGSTTSTRPVGALARSHVR
jgi:hypothetical protein